MANNNETLALSMGRYGATIVTDTAATTGKFCAIQFITAGAFSALTLQNSTGTFTGVTYPVGFVIYGDITAFTLSAGSVIAYKGDIP